MGDGLKHHLGGWNTVCTPIANGRLDARRLVTFNQAFLGKWKWRFETEALQLWRRIVAVKYGEGRGGLCMKNVNGTHDCS